MQIFTILRGSRGSEFAIFPVATLDMGLEAKAPSRKNVA